MGRPALTTGYMMIRNGIAWSIGRGKERLVKSCRGVMQNREGRARELQSRCGSHETGGEDDVLLV